MPILVWEIYKKSTLVITCNCISNSGRACTIWNLHLSFVKLVNSIWRVASMPTCSWNTPPITVVLYIENKRATAYLRGKYEAKFSSGAVEEYLDLLEESKREKASKKE